MSRIISIAGLAENARMDEGNPVQGPDEHWTTVQAENAGQPLIVRIRTDLGKQDLQARWPNRMVALWRFPAEGPDGSRGLPSPAQQTAMGQFEDAVEAALAAAGVAILTSVATTRGAREWVWYCGQAPEFNRAFNAALRGHPRYPLALQVAPDPAWRQWRGLLAALGLTPS
jgi:hypothetical protein